MYLKVVAYFNLAGFDSSSNSFTNYWLKQALVAGFVLKLSEDSTVAALKMPLPYPVLDDGHEDIFVWT